MPASHAPARAHDHDFGLDAVQPGERRTLAVVVITATFMAAEIGGGLLFGSMALLADGLHMASHAVALGVSLAAYIYARRRAHDQRFSFGVGKVNALAGFSSALLLVVFALGMAAGSVDRLIEPRPITYAAALPIAVVGLLVNLVSVWILAGSGHRDGHAHGHGHAHENEHEHGQGHGHGHGHGADPNHDHNLRSAYLHVLADTLTSVLAIGALLGAQYLGWTWLDPVMGLLGALLVARWSWQLLRTTSRVLLDHQVGGEDLAAVRAAIEGPGPDEVVDLHVWEIGPGLRAACVTVESASAQDPDRYRERLPADLHIAHATIEVRGNPRGAAT